MAEILDFNDGKGRLQNPDVAAKNEALANYVWTCGKCGNSTFQLVRGGTIRCAHCNEVSTKKSHFDADGAVND